MSDPTNIFANTNSPATPDNNGAPSTAPNVQQDQAVLTLLSEIKNERGEPKYKSLPDALNALKHSQEYIPQLSTQLAQKDAELTTARAAAAKIEELERSLLALTRQSEPTTTPVAGMTAEQVAEIVNRTLTDSQKQSQALANTQTVATALQSKLGTEAESQYKAKAEEMGISVQELNVLAAKSPKMVLSMFGASAPVATGAPMTSTVNTTAMQPHQDTFITRPQKSVLIGATTDDLNRERLMANKMVEELEAKGMSIRDLTDPKVYMKHFGRK